MASATNRRDKHQPRVTLELIAVVTDQRCLRDRAIGQSLTLDASRFVARASGPGAREQMAHFTEIIIQPGLICDLFELRYGRFKINFRAKRERRNQSRIIERA